MGAPDAGKDIVLEAPTRAEGRKSLLLEEPWGGGMALVPAASLQVRRAYFVLLLNVRIGVDALVGGEWSGAGGSPAAGAHGLSASSNQTSVPPFCVTPQWRASRSTRYRPQPPRRRLVGGGAVKSAPPS